MTISSTDPRIIALQSDNVEIAWLIALKFRYSTASATSWPKDITLTFQSKSIFNDTEPTSHTFMSNVGVLLPQFEQKSGKQAHRPPVNLTFIDYNQQWSKLFKDGSAQVRVSIWWSLLLDGTFSAPLPRFIGGKCDGWSESVNEGAVLVSARFVAPLQQLTATNPFRLTDSQQRTRDSNDNSLEHIDRQNWTKWGGKP